MSGHQCKAGSDWIGEIQEVKGFQGQSKGFFEEAFLRGGGWRGTVPVLLGERQDARSGGGDVGVGPLTVAALLVGEAGLQPALDLRVGEAEVAGGLPHLAHHQHLLLLAA